MSASAELGRDAELFNLYSRARRDLTLRQLVGCAPEWPDRPATLPADFGEEYVAAIALELREAWAIAHPRPAQPEDVPAAPNGFAHIAAEWDIDALIAWVDEEAERAAGLAAGAALQRLRRSEP